MTTMGQQDVSLNQIASRASSGISGTVGCADRSTDEIVGEGDLKIEHMARVHLKTAAMRTRDGKIQSQRVKLETRAAKNLKIGLNETVGGVLETRGF